jgi:hypothetical protein
MKRLGSLAQFQLGRATEPYSQINSNASILEKSGGREAQYLSCRGIIVHKSFHYYKN